MTEVALLIVALLLAATAALLAASIRKALETTLSRMTEAEAGAFKVFCAGCKKTLGDWDSGARIEMAPDTKIEIRSTTHWGSRHQPTIEVTLSRCPGCSFEPYRLSPVDHYATGGEPR